jgi:hypothetical protein
MPRTTVFTPDWPFYAVVAHVIFWIVSALFVLGCVAGYFGFIGGQAVVTLFWLIIISAFALGLTAAFSGRLYIGNQVFSRTPMVGPSARMAGMIYAALAAFIMFFAYGLMQLGH